MSEMGTAPAHAKPARRDLLWVLVLILACGLLEVWASWLQIGAVSGFPKLGSMTTGWILPVTSEAYWGAALYAWLAAPAGPRSRKFAMWSAGGVFLLSLCGQESDHLLAAAGRTVPPVGVVGFVTALPLIAVALIAVLIHLRHLDRDEAEKAEEAARKAEQRAEEAQRKAERDAAEEAAAGDERTALRAELDAARGAVEPLQADLVTARAELARVTAKAEALTRKLEAATARKRAGATGRKRAPATARKSEPATAPETESDVDREALVLKYLSEGRKASEAGRLAGLSDSRGRQIARKLAAAAPKGQDPEDSP